MTQPTYAELLRHPEWQKKRLRVMERAEFRCAECGDNEATLNVHHSYYTKGAKPWEYPDESLKCLCEACHERRHAMLNEAKQLLGFLSSGSLAAAIGYVKAKLLGETFFDGPPSCLPTSPTGKLLLPVGTDDPNEVMGMADAHGLRHCSYWEQLMSIAAANGGVTRADLMQLWESKLAATVAAQSQTVEGP